MTKTQPAAGLVFVLLALLMALTRIHHFGFMPDASWAVFFLAGLWLDGRARWLLPVLLAEAVAIDYAVIHSMGISFWEHYCVSAAYWFLIPAYASLWLGGRWLAAQPQPARRLGLLHTGAAIVVSEAVCYLISNGSFYWLSASVPKPRTFGHWFANLADWYLPFLGGMLLYTVAAIALYQLLRSALAATRPAPVNS